VPDERKTYPKFSKAAWFTLRDRAQKSPSAKITPSIVQAMFNMASADSAKDNIVRPLRLVNLIDDDGALTELGQLWRNDDTYGEACQQILSAFYPADLEHLGDVAAIERWFTGQGFGASNARQMASTYNMLSAPSIPTEVPQPAAKKNGKTATPDRKTTEAARPLVKNAQRSTEIGRALTGAIDETAPRNDGPPSLQMNLQIHLPSDATADQIDTIFASMAKHLYKR
jgi:hypothetical protein